MAIPPISSAAKVTSMKFLLARPSSLHDDPSQAVKWGEDGLPKVYRGKAAELIADEPLLIQLFDAIVEREVLAGVSQRKVAAGPPSH